MITIISMFAVLDYAVCFETITCSIAVTVTYKIYAIHTQHGDT